MTFARLVRLLLVLVIAAGIAAWPPSLLAQSNAGARQYDPAFDGAPGLPGDDGWGEIPAYVSTISGDARLDRDGELTSDFEQVPLLVGDQLRTTRGRVEVLYSDGSVLALDEYSAVTIDTESTWRLHTGRVKVVARGSTFALDAVPIGVARLRGNGNYRVTVAVNRRGDPEMELAVTRGSAELENPLGRTLVREGTRALTTEAYAPSIPYAFAAPRDDFERWTESLEADRYGVESARYLPAELRAYGGDFDRYGYWSHHSSYGWVWYPRVSVGWEPFHSGRWSFVIGFGYNWIGGSRWEWPTHYYGRWDRGGPGWFWVPSRTVQFRRIGYSAPRRSIGAPVSYYSRPPASRHASSFRGNTDSRSRIVEPSREGGRPGTGGWNTPSTPQPRIAIPRTAPATRDSRPMTFPSNRTPNNPVYGARPAPESSRPETPGGRDRRPSTRSPARTPAPPPSAPSVESPQRSSRGGERSQPTVGRLPDPTVARPPSGSRTPSSPSRPPSGTAVRRGGGGR